MNAPAKLIYAREVLDDLKHYHPSTKRGLRTAIETLSFDTSIGKPLRDEFEGLYSLRFKRYRIIYRYQKKKSQIEIILIGQRFDVYERLASYLRQDKKS